MFDRTYRIEPGPVNYWHEAQRLMGRKVVIYLPDNPESRRWKGGFLTGLLPGEDKFIVKWSRRGFGRVLIGIWRIHPTVLFTGTNLLPIPRYPARVPESTNRSEEDHRMATRKPAAKASTPTRRAAAKKPAADAETNGAKKSTGRTRGADKLAGLSEARRRNIAKLIHRERGRKPATSWTDIGDMIQDKYDWTLPGSMTGRRLLRDYGPEGAESVIIKQDKTKSADGAKKKKDTAKAKATTTRRRAKQVEEELDEDEEEEDEELEDEDEEEMEEDLEDEDEDEDEDEEDEEEEEPIPAPKSRKVRVTRTRKSNPSK